MSSRSVNHVMLLGRLGKDAECRFTPSGVSVATFSIATTYRKKEGSEWRDMTDWHNIVLWKADKASEYLKKGTQVFIEGRLQTRNYENKEGRKVYVTEVVAEELILLGTSGADQPARSPVASKLDDDLGITEADMPF